MAVDLPRGAYVRLLAAVYLAMFLIRVAFGITVVTFAHYLEAGDFLYALVVTASPLLELATVIFTGVLIDRYGRKGVLLTGVSLAAISLYGLALTRNPLALAGVNALHGIAAALILVTTLAVIATFAPPDRRGREMGLFNLANLFGWIVGFIIGALLLDLLENNVGYTFVIAGTLAVVGLFPVNKWVTLREDRTATPSISRRPSMRDLLRAVFNARILLLTAPWLIVFMLVGAFITFFPRIAGTLNISGGSTALGVIAIGGLLIASQLFWGRLADRHGRETIMLVGATGFALFMGLIVYAFFETGSADGQVIFQNVADHGLLLALFLFIALAFAPAGLAAIADEAQEGAQGTTMSAYSLTLSLGFIIGPTVLGAVSEAAGGTGMVLYFAALAGILITLVLTRYLQSRRAAKDAGATEASP